MQLQQILVMAIEILDIAYNVILFMVELIYLLLVSYIL